MNVRDSSQNPIALGAEIARAGEGSIRLVDRHPEFVCKIYHQPSTLKEEKLSWMVAHPPPDPTIASLGHISIAWPKTLLYSQGRFVGFIMPRIGAAVPILKAYNPKLRNQTLPGFDWKYLHRAAINFVSAASALHSMNYVIGDINESNTLVHDTALVSLIDTDSFQVSAGRKTFRCPVGKPEFSPPELQSVTFADVDRDQYHDSFAIGVLVYLLLMEGNHPYRSKWIGTGDPPETGVKIQRGLFAHQQPPPRNVIPVAGAPKFSSLHPLLQQAMLSCFVDGTRDPRLRPTAESWEDALKAAEAALVHCGTGHVYSGHLKSCPHCAVAVRALPASPKPPVLPTPPISAKPPALPKPPTVPKPPARPKTPAGSRRPTRQRSKRHGVAMLAVGGIAALAIAYSNGNFDIPGAERLENFKSAASGSKAPSLTSQRVSTSPAKAAGHYSAPLDDYLPSSSVLPGGLVVNGVDRRSLSELASNYLDPAHTQQYFTELGFDGALLARYGLPASSSQTVGTSLVNIGITQFYQPAAAAAALDYSHQDQLSGGGVRELILDYTIGSTTRVLVSNGSDGYGATVRFLLGNLVFRVSAYSPSSDPLSDVLTIAESIVEASNW